MGECLGDLVIWEGHLICSGIFEGMSGEIFRRNLGGIVLMLAALILQQRKEAAVGSRKFVGTETLILEYIFQGDLVSNILISLFKYDSLGQKN